MARDEQQAMSDERLARALALVRLLTVPGVMAPEAADAIQDVVAEVERLRAENEQLAERLAAATLVAEALEGLQEVMKSLLKRNGKMREIVQAVADAWDYEGDDDGVSAPYYRVTISGAEDVHAKARALLASAEAETEGESEASDAAH